MIKYDYMKVKFYYDDLEDEQYWDYEHGYEREDALKILREEGQYAVDVGVINGDGDVYGNKSNRCCELRAQRSVYKNGVLRMLGHFEHSDVSPSF